MRVFVTSLASDIPAAIVTETKKLYTDSTRTSVLAATNGGRLRNVGKSGASVGVFNRQEGATAFVRARGPLHLIEWDNSPHEIPSATRTRRQRTAAGRLSHKRESTGRQLSQRRILVINGNVITGPVKHPGTKGKHPFEKGILAVGDGASAASQVVFRNALESLFRG
jgi:hypothetical protein